MTLKQTSSSVLPRQRAIVIEMSMAGLLATHVFSGYPERITLMSRHRLEERSMPPRVLQRWQMPPFIQEGASVIPISRKGNRIQEGTRIPL